MIPRLKEQYEKKIISDLQKEFSLKNKNSLQFSLSYRWVYTNPSTRESWGCPSRLKILSSFFPIKFISANFCWLSTIFLFSSFFSWMFSISSSISFSSIVLFKTICSSVSFCWADSLTLLLMVLVTLITSLVTSIVEHPQINNNGKRNKNIRIALMVKYIYVICLWLHLLNHLS